MVDLATVTINPELLKLIPRNTALELSVLPVTLENDTVVVASSSTDDDDVLADLEFLLGRRVRIERAPAVLLADCIRRHYSITDVEVRRQASKESHEYISAKKASEVEGVDHGQGETSVVALANRIISDAIRMGASDIHVEPYERSMRVRYRLDGMLHEVLRPSTSQAKAILSRLKIMSDLDIAERRRPQDGRMRVQEGDSTIDIRVSVLPTDFGEKIVLRILDRSHLQLDLNKLGFEEHALQQFKQVLQVPYGMVLVTGPTGSGKTTTLYAALNHINRPDINITTIEDPIEYHLPGINQTHVRSEIGLTFASALRSILRQDPNVIMVGEIRDVETAEIAIRAALTGHLVFSTLHTNDAPSAIVRLTDMGIEPFLVASSVKLILAQRLLRRLCEKCKFVADPAQGFLPKGCPACHHSGYSGRTAVFEVLPIQGDAIEIIAKRATVSEIRETAHALGLTSLYEAATLKAQRGETSLSEVLRETVSI